MNWVHVFLIVIIILAMWAGWHRGFILGSLDLLTWIGSLSLAYVFYPYTENLLSTFFQPSAWLLPIAFILTAVVARILLGLFKRFLVKFIPVKANETWFNRVFGIIPGAINGYIYAVIISALLLALPIDDRITKETRDSKMAVQLAMQSEWVNKKLAPVFDQAIRQTINSLTINPHSDEEVQLGFTNDNPVTRPTLEAKMLELVNRERAKAGVKLLKADPELNVVARAHSKDMFARGYFAHVNPDGKDPFERMKAAHVRFYAAGENLALAQTLEIAHKNLMNSPGHRANILNPAFGRLGIGVLDGGFYGLMISQEFRD
jgi:uncharacterized protein YkwD